MSNRSEGAVSNYLASMIAKSWHREVMVAGLVLMACVSAPAGGVMAQATPPPFQGCPPEGACGGFELPLFPPPGETLPPDGGVAPQAGAPILNTPALLVTKPRVVPDLDGRFSNGGNEEIW